MEQFGDELIIQSFKIPWLIWIHLLVTVLLVILLFFGFTVFTSDDSISRSSSTAASPSTCSSAAVPAHLTKPSSSNRKSKETSLDVRCCRHSFHLQKSCCLACACPGTRKRTCNWSVIRLETIGSGHMRYLHHVSAYSRPTLEKVEDMKVRRDAGTSGGTSKDEDQIIGEPSGKDSMFSRIFRHPNHPCSYLGLAKEALFKCFGFDSSSDSPSRQHEKQE